MIEGGEKAKEKGEERCVQIQVERETCAERVLMASFMPQQPSLLLEHLSGALSLPDDHIDTCWWRWRVAISGMYFTSLSLSLAHPLCPSSHLTYYCWLILFQIRIQNSCSVSKTVRWPEVRMMDLWSGWSGVEVTLLQSSAGYKLFTYNQGARPSGNSPKLSVTSEDLCTMPYDALDSW